MIKKVISGGQTGADQAGLRAAKSIGLETGGMVPLGCLTESGSNPHLITVFNMHESKSSKYPPRTYDNVKNSTGTIRFAYNFNSNGEKLTLKAILSYQRPYFDVDVTNLPPVSYVVDWLKANQIEILNVSGNRESTYPGIGAIVEKFLIKVFQQCDY